jgi:hypothetical protein
MIRTLSILVIFFGTIGAAQAQPVERVVGIDVSNSRAHVAALDRLFGSDAARGQKATLWVNEFGGSAPNNRTLVIEHEDYADFVARGDSIGGSRDWLDFQHAIDGTSNVTSSRLAVQRMIDGSGWENHGALVAFSMTVSDPTAYAEAFSELIRSSDNPGSVRLMEMRFGGEGTTHTALISAPGFVEMNEYLDELLSSDAYRRFSSKVSDIRKINTVSYLRRIKSWGN